MKRNLLFALIISVTSLSVNGQCTDWISPTSTTAWTNFDISPCDGASIEFDGFEVYKSEAYALYNAVVEGNYTFSICNGPNAGSWIPEFTIIAPSGAIETFGAGDGDGCSITFTASEAGTYFVVINEADNCGIDGSVDNGYPMITTNYGGSIGCSSPAVFMEGAESFEADTLLPDCWQALDADGDGYNWKVGTGTNAGFDGNRVIMSQSWSGVPLTPDNYLVTPQLSLGTDESLYYVVKASSPAYPAEHYSILISTTGSDIADFSDVLFTETLRKAEWLGRSINLSAYNDQTVYLAFRHYDVTDKERIHIDVVKLPGTVICNPTAVTELDNVELRLFPNPATDKLNITSSLQGAATVRVFDALGRIVLENNVSLSQAAFTQNISSLENGIYTIQISTTAKVATQRFVKQ